MTPFRPALPLLLLSFLRGIVADYDPRNYDDLYELSEYYSSLYMNEDSDMLDDAFGCVTRLLALSRRPTAFA